MDNQQEGTQPNQQQRYTMEWVCYNCERSLSDKPYYIEIIEGGQPVTVAVCRQCHEGLQS